MADGTKFILLSCLDRIDILHRYIVKLGTATVLMCMIYLREPAATTLYLCLDPHPFLTPLSEGQGFLQVSLQYP